MTPKPAFGGWLRSALEMGLVVVGGYPLKWGVMACQFQKWSRLLSTTLFEGRGGVSAPLLLHSQHN